MVIIIQANEAANLAEKGKKKFEKDALEGSEFKSLIREVEENAMEGRTGFTKLLQSEEKVRVYEIFVVALKKAGYQSSIKLKRPLSILGFPDTDCVFYVSWKQEEEQE